MVENTSPVVSSSTSSSDRQLLEFINQSTTTNESCTPQPSLGFQIPSSFIKNLTSIDGKVITHGYVHGHIHKHKDHTHIHGHIHNHDHVEYNKSNEQNSPQLALNEPEQSFSCHEFENLDACKDVFCDELDDCFFLNCDDSKYSNTCDLNCCNSSAIDEICCTDASCIGDKDDHSQTPSDCCNNPDCNSYSVCQAIGRLNSSVCTDPSCKDADVCCVTPEKDHNHFQHAENNLCDLQLCKKPIFEDLISNIHSTYKNQNSNEIPDPPRKKPRTQTDFEIHFPHECHPEDKDKSRSVENHEVHQSCFHTTIPDSGNTTPSEVDQNLMSDFDFVIQFNNFNQYLNEMSGNPQSCTSNNQTSNIDNTSIAVNSPNIGTSVKMNTSSNNGILQPPRNNSPLLYSCQWEKCFKRVNADTFLTHVVEDHLEHEQITSKQAPESTYQCEWSDCNFMNNDYNTLIDHLKSHQPSNLILPTQPSTANNALTPVSCSISNAASPVVLQQPVATQPTIGEFNITSMKIMPKTRKKETIQDPEFKCHWQIGIDSDGNPVPCNLKHENEGDLQNHILEDHIGAGKSKYNCEWIGCERHNGKHFPQRQKLIRHIHIHTNYKPCKCEICGACFAVKSMLDQHVRIHSGEKPFRCSICGKKFATSSSLSIHNRVHTGERPLVCTWPGCNKRFSESSNLTKHMKIHTKTYNCEICGKTFDKKASFTRHISEHSQNDKTTLKQENVVSI